jgi:hypothetical protein
MQQYCIQFRLETREDHDLYDYIRELIIEKSHNLIAKKIKEVRPSIYAYGLLNERQQKIHNLLYSKEKCECPVCYEEISDINEIITDCNHNFCKKCFDKFTQETNSCPYCRNEIEEYRFIKLSITQLILTFSYKIWLYSYTPQHFTNYPKKWKFMMQFCID